MIVPISKETTDFARACEAIHAVSAIKRLTADEQNIIEFSCNELLLKVRPA